jgi:hypothetical protein
MIKVKVPDSWDEITIGQFQEIAKEDRESKNYALNVISIILDKDPEEIRKYHPLSADKIMKHLEWAMKSPPEDSYKQEIEIDGITYRLVENLNRLSGGEWWDMEEYLSDFESNVHSIFSILYRPRGEYTFDKRKETANIFLEKAMIGDMYGSLVFFSNVGKKSMLTIQDYLIQSLKTEKREPRKN